MTTHSTTQASDGLLFVYAETGTHVTEKEFNDWYDNEHIPPRLALAGLSTARRYRQADGKSPAWLAIYDTDTPDVLQSDAYKQLAIDASANEKSIISRLAILNRSIYKRIKTVENPHLVANSLPSQTLVVVSLLPDGPDGEEDLNKWYAEEHLPLLSKVPGFIRARRYELVSNVELAGKADPANPVDAFPYVTVYDWASDQYLDEPAYKEASATPWIKKIIADLKKLERRSFALHKNFA